MGSSPTNFAEEGYGRRLTDVRAKDGAVTNEEAFDYAKLNSYTNSCHCRLGS